MERRQDDDGRKAWENGATGAGCGGQHVGWPCMGIVGWEGASSVLTDTLCASGPEGRLLGAREGLRAGAVKAEGCSPSRNSDQVKIYLGAEALDSLWTAPTATRSHRRSDPPEGHKAAGSWNCFLVDAGDAGCILMPLMRSCAVVEELGGAGPRFLCPARGWQRAGDGPATAARPFPAAASPGSSGGKPSHWERCSFLNITKIV